MEVRDSWISMLLIMNPEMMRPMDMSNLFSKFIVIYLILDYFEKGKDIVIVY